MSKVLKVYLKVSAVIIAPLPFLAAGSRENPPLHHSSMFEAIADCSQRSDAPLAIKGCSAIIKSTLLNSELQSKAYNNRGNAFYLLGKTDKAINDYSKAIELNPHYSSALFNRGHSLIKLGKFGSAIHDFSHVIKLKPDFAIAFKFRGDAYQGHRKFKLALKDYNQALVINPEFTEAFINRGILREKMGQKEKAISDYASVLKIDKFNKIAMERLEKLGLSRKFIASLVRSSK